MTYGLWGTYMHSTLSKRTNDVRFKKQMYFGTCFQVNRPQQPLHDQHDLSAEGILNSFFAFFALVQLKMCPFT